jgi:flagellar basal-body rod modification protein FlgD
MINNVTANPGLTGSTAAQSPFVAASTAGNVAPSAADQSTLPGATAAGQIPLAGASAAPPVTGAASPLSGSSTTAGAQSALPFDTSGAAGSSSTGSDGTSSTATPSSSQDVTGTDTFLKLLVAQLQNQDPMSPMDDQSFVTELAQFNTVEQMLGVKQSIDNELGAQQASEGVAMLGKTITYSVPGIGGNPATVSQGVVSGVSLASGQVQLQVGTQNVPLSGVTAVSS